MSLPQSLDQEIFKSSRRVIPLQRSSQFPLKVFPVIYNQKAVLSVCRAELPYRLVLDQVGHLETLLIPEWYTGFDEDYDPFAEEQGKDISGFTWKYYGWADIGCKTVCGNGAVSIPRLTVHELQNAGIFHPRTLSK